MATPSRSSKGSVSWVAPLGQTTETSYPAFVSDMHSCQTRRSNGTERFSTRMATLPRDPGTPLVPGASLRIRWPVAIDDVGAVLLLDGSNSPGAGRATPISDGSLRRPEERRD